MTPEQWKKVRDIYERAMRAPEESRDAMVGELSAGDAKIASTVLKMLEAHASDNLLEIGAPIELESLVTRVDPTAPEDLVIERYRVLRRIGEGGMGVVYEAERADGTYEQRVAIKVLKRGMDTALFLRRFESERAALSRLAHPNVARMLDAGSTADGRPYLVMDLVEGRPIHRYCDENCLSIRKRIELFLQVVAGVAHAHRNLILHRDIKPGNILVNSEGRVQLLDFGIAKALDAGDGSVTVTSERFLTPRYASPEMINAGSLTTASDVYSMGVVLYELLTGAEPYQIDEPTPRAYERAIREQTPILASTAVMRRADTSETTSGMSTTALRRTLRGDLDVIFMRALAKEPDRRYPTAQALGDELRAYLGGLPVSARPDSVLYRTRKLVRRAPIPVGITTVAIVAIIALTVYSLVQRSRAEDATDVALQRLKDIEEQKEVADGVLEFYTNDVLGQADPETGQIADMPISVALRRASDSISERFADKPLVEAKIQQGIGYIMHQRTEYADAEPHLKRAWDLSEEHLGADDIQTLLAKRDYANCLSWQGRHDEALALFGEVLASQRRRWPEAHETMLTVSLMGGELEEVGRLGEAESYLLEAYEWRRRTLGDLNGNTMTSMNNLAHLYATMGRLDDARPLFERNMELRIEEYGPKHPRTLIARANYATLLVKMGQRAEGIERLREVRADQLEVLGPDHGHTQYVKGLLESLGESIGD
ncbi:MAG: serine/threonine protein kinase [Phycisphaeraceae bacterium]|nr:serine/threonine protein kinase [Phycisphaerales bacterium]MCB9844279.1 serine/threonine protein kinase [Phycisphaeraceae bacterium]